MSGDMFTGFKPWELMTGAAEEAGQSFGQTYQAQKAKSDAEAAGRRKLPQALVHQIQGGMAHPGIQQLMEAVRTGKMTAEQALAEAQKLTQQQPMQMAAPSSVVPDVGPGGVSAPGTVSPSGGPGMFGGGAPQQMPPPNQPTFSGQLTGPGQKPMTGTPPMNALPPPMSSSNPSAFMGANGSNAMAAPPPQGRAPILGMGAAPRPMPAPAPAPIAPPAPVAARPGAPTVRPEDDPTSDQYQLEQRDLPFLQQFAGLQKSRESNTTKENVATVGAAVKEKNNILSNTTKTTLAAMHERGLDQRHVDALTVKMEGLDDSQQQAYLKYVGDLSKAQMQLEAARIGADAKVKSAGIRGAAAGASDKVLLEIFKQQVGMAKAILANPSNLVGTKAGKELYNTTVDNAMSTGQRLGLSPEQITPMFKAPEPVKAEPSFLDRFLSGSSDVPAGAK